MLPDPTYISVAELKANTLITALAVLEDANVEKLIQRAESQIDKHVGRQQHHPDDENTDRVFPREVDFDDYYAAIIPLPVSEACLAQVEYLYLNWWPTRATGQQTANRTAVSESIGGDGSYSADYVDASTRPENFLCPHAIACLDGFVNRFVGLSVTDPDDVPPAT